MVSVELDFGLEGTWIFIIVNDSVNVHEGPSIDTKIREQIESPDDHRLPRYSHLPQLRPIVQGRGSMLLV